MSSTRRRSPALSRLARLHAVSTAADAAIAVALAGSLFFNVSTDVARPRLALYLLLTLAPVAIMTPLLGPVLDRLGGRRGGLLAAAGAARAGLALLLATNSHTLLLYPESLAILVIGRAYSVVKRSLVPLLVDDDRDLVAANARLSRVGTLAGLTGGLLASGVLHFFGTSSVLVCAAVGHAGATILATRLHATTTTIRPAEPAPAAPEGGAPARRGPMLAMGTLRATNGIVVFLLAFALDRESGPSPLLGVVALAIAVGSFAGTYVSPRLRELLDERSILRLAVTVALVTAVVAALAGDVGSMLLAVFTVALASSVGRHACDSVLQRSAGAATRSRVFARCETGLQLAWVGGALIPTVFVVDVRAGFAVAALVLGASAVGLGRERGTRRRPFVLTTHAAPIPVDAAA